jgi:hypothetical protein
MSDMKEDRVASSPALMLSWNFVFCVVGIPASGLRDHVIGEWPQMGYLSCVTANGQKRGRRGTHPGGQAEQLQHTSGLTRHVQ